jgi:hypothetical protein
LRTCVLSAVAIVGSMSISDSAFALTMKAVYEGTVSGSYDETDLFGKGSGSNVLDGQTFSLTYVFDPDLPGVVNASSFASSSVYGGTFYRATNPTLSALLNIGGTTFSMRADWFGFTANSNDGPTSFSYVNLGDNSVTGTSYETYRIYAYAFDATKVVPLDMTTPFSIDPVSGFAGAFSFTQYNFSTNGYSLNTYGNLDVKSLNVSRVSAVPVPAALPLLVTGLAMAGAISRRKKKKIVD